SKVHFLICQKSFIIFQPQKFRRQQQVIFHKTENNRNHKGGNHKSQKNQADRHHISVWRYTSPEFSLFFHHISFTLLFICPVFFQRRIPIFCRIIHGGLCVFLSFHHS